MASNKRTVAAIALGLILLAIIVTVVRGVHGCHKRAEARRPLVRPFWCEACQEEFMTPYRGPTAICPKCKHKTSIIRHYYVCSKCGERFLAYDVDMSSEMARLPDGGWDQLVYRLPGSFECPKCGSDETALEKHKKHHTSSTTGAETLPLSPTASRASGHSANTTLSATCLLRAPVRRD